MTDNTAMEADRIAAQEQENKQLRATLVAYRQAILEMQQALFAMSNHSTRITQVLGLSELPGGGPTDGHSP